MGFKISEEASADNGQCQLASVRFVESYSTRLLCKVSEYSICFIRFTKPQVSAFATVYKLCFSGFAIPELLDVSTS